MASAMADGWRRIDQNPALSFFNDSAPMWESRSYHPNTDMYSNSSSGPAS